MNEPGVGENPPHKETDLSGLEVIIAEDNFALRTVNKRYVEGLGLKGKVHATEDAQKAIEKYNELEEQNRRANVVVTDVNMGSKTGVELANDLWEKDPQLQVIFVTSESEEFLREQISPDRHFLYAGKSQLQKDPNILEQRIREAASIINSRATKK